MKTTDYYLVYTLFFTEILFHCVTTLHIFLIFYCSEYWCIQCRLISHFLLFYSSIHMLVCFFSFALGHFFSCSGADLRICILLGTSPTSHISGTTPHILLCKFVCVREIEYLFHLSGSFWWTAGFIPSSVRVPNEAFPSVFTYILPNVTFAHNHEEHTWTMALSLWELKAVRLRSQLTTYDTRICFWTDKKPMWIKVLANKPDLCSKSGIQMVEGENWFWQVVF